MTIASSTTQTLTPCNGTTTNFAFANKIFAAADLVATLIDTVGNLYAFTPSGLNTFTNSSTGLSYTVFNIDIDAGCFIVFSAAPTNGWSLDLRTAIAELQSTSIKNQGAFLPELHEEFFDRITRELQDLRRLTYTFGIHGPDIETAVWPALPGPALRKSFALMFDAVTGLPELGFLSAQNVTQGLLASLLYPQTAAEQAAGVTPTNIAIPSHVQLGYILLERYVAAGTNTGTTDMGPALNTAITIALTNVGVSTGKYGIPIRFQAGAYLFSTQPVFGAPGINIVPVDIGGQGYGTQLINGLTINTKPLFAMDSINGWYLHDFVMCGSDTFKNIGIRVNSTGGSESIEWRVSRVISLMAGIGFYVADTNTGTIEDCSHWPGNNPPLIIAQSVSVANISHGIYMTGNFVHNVRISKGLFNSNSNYGISGGVSTMRGIKMDCTFSFGVVIDSGPIAQTLSGLNNEIGPDIAPSNEAQSMVITGLYGEGSTLRLSNVVNSLIGPVTNGTIGGALRLDGTCRFNVIQNACVGIIDITDNSGASQGNIFMGCQTGGAAAYVNTTTYVVGNYVSSGGVQYRCIATTTGNAPPNAGFWTVINNFNDSEEAANLSSVPNRLIGGILSGGVIADVGFMYRKLLAYSASMTSNVLGPNHNVIRVQTAAAMTLNAPSNPRNGAEQQFTFRNESGGAMGAITWFSTPGGWANPANGFNRSVCFYYDSDFSAWKTKWVGTVDQPN